MESDKRIVNPGPNGSLSGEKGEKLVPPDGWSFLPAGDAGITRKVTSKGIFWRVQVKKGRRTISKGIWAPATTIVQAQKEMRDIRSSGEYEKKRQYALNLRQKKQDEYESAFRKEVETFLNFHEIHKATEKILAKAVTAHAIPVGSGTVARTSMIPIEERAARAVIAWMRHHTTAYDNLNIARIKGERRAVRRMLAERSVALLAKYRQNTPIAGKCPIQKAVKKIS